MGMGESTIEESFKVDEKMKDFAETLEFADT
jgi:hypothetical protein